jgi:hypothetical protein
MPQTMPLLALAVLAALAGVARAQEARMVPVTVDGERVRLVSSARWALHLEATRSVAADRRRVPEASRATERRQLEAGVSR